MYCDQRSQYIRLNSKKNSFRGNYSRKYGSSFSPVAIIFIFFKFSHMDPLILLLSWHIKCSKLFVAEICQHQLKLGQKKLHIKKIGFSSHIFFHHLDQERGETNLWLSSAPKVWRHFSMNIDASKNNLFRLFSCDVSFFYPFVFLNKANNKFNTFIHEKVK